MFKDLIANRIKHYYSRLANTRIIDRRELYQLWEETHLQRLFRHYDIDCVFDIGANYGQYASMLRRKVGFKGLIISFEPIPAAAEAMRQKGLGDSKWVVEEQAVASHDGEQTLNVMVGSQFTSLSTPRHDEVDLFRNRNKIEQTVTVKTETLITAYQRIKATHNFKRPFLKMDTQGYDVEIVKHAKPVLKEFIGMQSELAVKKLYQHSTDFREALTLYEECGFALSAFVPNNSGHFPRLVETDCIMARQELLDH